MKRPHLLRRRVLPGAMIALPALSRGAAASARSPGSTQAAFMARAFACRDESVRRGDQPYGAVVVREGSIVDAGAPADG